MEENRFTLDPNFLMPVPEELPTIEELEEYLQGGYFLTEEQYDLGMGNELDIIGCMEDELNAIHSEAQAPLPFSSH